MNIRGEEIPDRGQSVCKSLRQERAQCVEGVEGVEQ